jgi:hypothetical protein
MPQGAGRGKAALSTAIRVAYVTSPIWRSSPVMTMAIRFVRPADARFDSPLATLALRDPEVADLTGAATRKGLVAAHT